MEKTWWDRLKGEVIDEDLCTRCGSCVGLSPKGTLEFRDVLGECLPTQTKGNSCNRECYEVCSGKYVSFPKLNEYVFGGQPENMLLGNYSTLAVGYATNKNIRAKAASGGVITSTLKFLLEVGEIDGAVVLGVSQREPWKPEVKIAKKAEEIIDAAQSKYVLSPVNTILRDLEKEVGSFAYVGLPCQVHSIRKLQMMEHSSVRNIKYIIGSYCGNILHFDSVRNFLRKNGVKNLKNVVSLEYRAGEWPGNMRVELKDGTVYSLDKFYANYLIPFYMVQRCLVCVDLSNEFADISCGDAWAPVYEERGKGWSLVLGRTPKGVGLLNRLCDEGVLSLQEMSEHDVINMHSHGLDFKKRGAFLRIAKQKRRGKGVPEYEIEPEDVGLQRRLFEDVLSFLFKICSLNISKIIVTYFPVTITGQLFKRARTIWKKFTKSTKKSGLSEVRFNHRVT